MTRIQLFLVLFMSICNSGMAQCTIENMTALPLACNSNGRFAMVIDFDFESPGSTQFRLSGNGVQYGVFNYADLPITINNLLGNCTTNYEFTVRDLNNPLCEARVNAGPVCCSFGCQVGLDQVTTESCVDGTFDLNLHPRNLSGAGSFYTVTIEGIDFGQFSFEQGAIRVENLDFGNRELIEVSICALGNESCCVQRIVESPCRCRIDQIQFQTIACDEVNKTFSIELDIRAQSAGDSVEVGGFNRFFGKFAYTDFPVTVTDISLDFEQNLIFAADTRTFFCFGETGEIAIEPCDTSCQLEIANMTFSQCNIDGSGTLDLQINGRNFGFSGLDLVREGDILAGWDYIGAGQQSLMTSIRCGDNASLVLRSRSKNACQSNAVVLDCCRDCTDILYEYGIQCQSVGSKNLILWYRDDVNPNDQIQVTISNFLDTIIAHSDFPLTWAIPEGVNELDLRIQSLDDAHCVFTRTLDTDCDEATSFENFTNVTILPCTEEGLMQIRFDSEGIRRLGDFQIFIQGKLFGTAAYGQGQYLITQNLGLSGIDGYCGFLADIEFIDDFRRWNVPLAQEEYYCCAPCQLENAEISLVECDLGTETFGIEIISLEGASFGYFTLDGSIDADGVLISLKDLPRRITLQNSTALTITPFNEFVESGCTEAQSLELSFDFEDDPLCVGTQVSDPAGAQIQLIQTPSYLEIHGSELHGVQLMDVLGHLIHKESPTIVIPTIRVDISDVPVGIYFLRVTTSRGQQVFKFVKV